MNGWNDPGPDFDEEKAKVGVLAYVLMWELCIVAAYANVMWR